LKGTGAWDIRPTVEAPMSTIDPLFGMHADALAIQQKRMGVLAANLANADTPNFQARDLDFAKMLAKEQGASTSNGSLLPVSTQDAGSLATTSALHIATSTPAAATHDPSLPYRVPLQPSVDGNTVDAQVEQGKYLDAAMHYEASLTFLNGQIHGLLTAITGQ
jgi:flagellar basal-body rod protein FlgB